MQKADWIYKNVEFFFADMSIVLSSHHRYKINRQATECWCAWYFDGGPQRGECAYDNDISILIEEQYQKWLNR